MHLMVLGASRPAGCGRCRGRNLFVSMHLMVLGASRHNGTLPLPDEQLVSMHLMVLGASRPSACCPLSRLGKRAPDRHWPKSALGPGCTSPIKADFAQFSQGSPPTDLLGLRATRMSTRPCGSGGRAVLFQYQCADAGHEPGSPGSPTAGRAEAGIVPGLGAPGTPRRRGDDGPAAGILVAGDGGGGPLLVALHAGQGGEHGDRVVDEASAGPGH